MSQLSTRAAFLINSLISCSAATTSEFPMQAMRAKRRTEKLKTELEEYISKVENPAMELYVEQRDE